MKPTERVLRDIAAAHESPWSPPRAKLFQQKAPQDPLEGFRARLDGPPPEDRECLPETAED